MSEKPMLCRERLREEGKPYPRSGCSICRTGGLTGCPYRATRAQPPQPQREATEADHQAVQAILDCWFNRDEILSIVIAHRLSTLPAAASVEAGERAKVRLPKLPEELYEFYPAMSAQSHEIAVKEYACAAIRALTAKGKDQADG